MIKMIGIRELDELLLEPDVMIVDLRDSESYRKYHLKDAKSYPYEEMNQWKDEVLENEKILLYCERGSESLMAARKLNKNTNEVYTLIGGIKGVQEFEIRKSIDSDRMNR